MQSNQRRAIEHLIGGGTNEQAAAIAGVSLRTLYNWKTEPEFIEELRTAQASALGDATLRLSVAAVAAAETLADIASDPEQRAAVRVQAARAILDSVLRMNDQLEIVRRLDDIEQQLKSNNEN